MLTGKKERPRISFDPSLKNTNYRKKVGLAMEKANPKYLTDPAERLPSLWIMGAAILALQLIIAKGVSPGIINEGALIRDPE